MTSYPKWLYHATEKAVIVETKEAHKALGKGWEETPVPANPEPSKAKK